MAAGLGIVFIIVGLVISVALHEAGHLIPAKLFGCRVSQYMVGFGPTLWSKTIGHTEYGIKAILLGGYCRILGMYGPTKKDTKIYRKGLKWCSQDEFDTLLEAEKSEYRITLAEQSRRAESAALAEHRTLFPTGGENRIGQSGERSFYELPVFPKLMVMLGGITMNLILGFLCLVLALGVVGVNAPSTTIEDLVCIQNGKPVACKTVKAGMEVSVGYSVAARAGLKPGDKILAVAQKSVSNWDEVRSQIKANQGKKIFLQIERDGQEKPFQLTLGQKGAGIISALERQRLGIGQISYQYGQIISGTGDLLVKLPQSVWQTAVDTFTGKKRSENSLMSVIGVGRLAGQISAAPADKVDFAAKLGALLSILASLNVALALFNLIPLPPLDGGHVIVVLWQGLRKWYARLRRLPDPGWMDASGLVPLTYVIATLLLGLTIVLFAADIFNPIKLFG